jgi:hypothetical protein
LVPEELHGAHPQSAPAWRNYRELMARCLSIDPAERPSSSKLLVDLVGLLELELASAVNRLGAPSEEVCISASAA